MKAPVGLIALVLALTLGPAAIVVMAILGILLVGLRKHVGSSVFDE